MRKIIILPVLAILIAIGLAGLIWAANPTCTFDQTATTAGTASTYLRPRGVGGSSGFNITTNLSVTISNAGHNASNNVSACTLTIDSGTITGALKFNTTDGSNNTYCNTSVNVMALSDKSYTFTMTMYNITGVEIGTACTRSYIPDNTVPEISSYIIDNNTASNTTANLGSTVSVSATVKNATSCNVYWKDTTANAMTTDYSDVDCTYTATWAAGGASATCSLKQNSDSYSKWYYDCTDGLNTTTGNHYKILAEGTWEPDIEPDDGLVIITTITELLKNKKVVVLGLISIVAILILVLALTTKKK